MEISAGTHIDFNYLFNDCIPHAVGLENWAMICGLKQNNESNCQIKNKTKFPFVQMIITRIYLMRINLTESTHF